MIVSSVWSSYSSWGTGGRNWKTIGGGGQSAEYMKQMWREEC